MYISIRPFRTQRGNYIPGGKMIPWWEYWALKAVDRKNFTDEWKYLGLVEEDYRKSLVVDYDDGREDDLPRLITLEGDTLIDQGDSADQFQGFGGGSGGGGAVGDWNDFHPHEDFNPADQAVIIDTAQQMFGRPDYPSMRVDPDSSMIPSENDAILSLPTEEQQDSVSQVDWSQSIVPDQQPDYSSPQIENDVTDYSQPDTSDYSGSSDSISDSGGSD